MARWCARVWPPIRGVFYPSTCFALFRGRRHRGGQTGFVGLAFCFSVGGPWQDRAVETISAASARRIVLAAQGFAEPWPTSTPTRRHLAKVLSRVQLLQLDSVNVAVRAHYMPLFSRL